MFRVTAGARVGATYETFARSSYALFLLVCWSAGIPRVWGQSAQTLKLIDAAKKEREVVVYGTMDLRTANVLHDKFREKYPFLEVKLNRAGSGALAPRALAEARAGKHLADILQTNSLSLHFLRKEGLLGHYVSPEDRFYPKQFKDQGYWTTTNMNVHVVAYNTRLLARERLSKTYDDFLNPLWLMELLLDRRTRTRPGYTSTSCYPEKDRNSFWISADRWRAMICCRSKRTSGICS